ncbi:hypothetical protein Taro_016593 [Colocasia esculenta]|uniref:Uncharacterized protein n=1 Tax=Colocasia esculenta TaxID=4460 RepID=A0A843UKQ8_COLES|nr:hypothetical protein [Colocasia esculenta]
MGACAPVGAPPGARGRPGGRSPGAHALPGGRPTGNNPILHQYSDSPHNDGEVLQGTINVIGRLSKSMDERIDAMIEMDRFKLKLDIYRDYDVKEAVTRMGPGEWWVMLDYKTGQRSPLARIAIRVLS